MPRAHRSTSSTNSRAMRNTRSCSNHASMGSSIGIRLSEPIRGASDRFAPKTSKVHSNTRARLAKYGRPAIDGLPSFTGGLVGFIGYDAVHRFEPTVPLTKPDELGFPEALWMD